MLGTGEFDVELDAQTDDDIQCGRMLIHKRYRGALEGVGRGQMLSSRNESGNAAYVAVEVFAGTLNGKQGSFTLIHQALMSPSSSSLDITVLEGSGTNELKGIIGALSINMEDESHAYEFTYDIKPS